MTKALRGLFLVGIFLVFPGEASAESPLAEADRDFTFKGQPIHPGLIREFQNWLSDYRPPITVTLDVGAAYDTNEYANAVTQTNDGGVSISSGDSGERFSYKHLGRLDNGVHVLHVFDKTGGTGTFQSLMFVQFDIAKGFDRDGAKPSERLLMSVVRVYALNGPPRDIRIKGNEVQIKSSARIIRLRFLD